MGPSPAGGPTACVPCVIRPWARLLQLWFSVRSFWTVPLSSCWVIICAMVIDPNELIHRHITHFYSAVCSIFNNADCAVSWRKWSIFWLNEGISNCLQEKTRHTPWTILSILLPDCDAWACTLTAKMRSKQQLTALSWWSLIVRQSTTKTTKWTIQPAQTLGRSRLYRNVMILIRKQLRSCYKCWPIFLILFGTLSSKFRCHRKATKRLHITNDYILQYNNFVATSV